MNFKSIISLVIVGLLSMVTADEIAGFRGLKWGDPSSKLKNKGEPYTTSETTSYRVINEDYLIGNATVNSIDYNFYKDRFFSVEISYSSQGVNRPACLECLIETKYNIKLPHTYTGNSSSYSGSDGYGNNIAGRTGYYPEKRVGYASLDRHDGMMTISNSKITNQKNYDEAIARKNSIKGF